MLIAIKSQLGKRDLSRQAVNVKYFKIPNFQPLSIKWKDNASQTIIGDSVYTEINVVPIKSRILM
jgi:hypothetical protein